VRVPQVATADLLSPGSPVQQRILKIVSEFFEMPPEKVEIGIDGCGVPVFGVPLYNAALAFAKLEL